MSMGIINHNISALNALRTLNTTSNKMNKNLERLSSGLRINRAADDAAGLAVSEKMRGQINGLDQAKRNAQDAISMIQTAEGVLDTSHSIVQRMRKLAVQAATDNYTTYDRKRIQKEINELTDELDRISNYTEFNTKKLLDGSATGVARTNRNKVLRADVVGQVVNADYSITVLDAGSACHIHGNANLADVSAANGGDADNIANLRDLGIYGDQELQIQVDGKTRAISVNENDTLEDVKRKINNANVGVIAGLDAEGNDLTMTSTHSGSRFNISFGDDPDGVAAKLGLVGGAEQDNTTVAHAYDSAGNDLGMSLFTSGTDTIISITNITNQSLFPTDPSVPSGSQGVSLGIFKSDSRIFTEDNLTNPINNHSVFQFLGGSSSATYGSSADLTQSGLLKGITLHIDEDITHGVLQQDDDDGGNTWAAGDYGHWTGYFDHTTSATGDGEGQGEVDPAVPNNHTIDPSGGLAAAGTDDSETGTAYDPNVTVRLSVRDTRQVYHIGANEGQTMTVDFGNMSSEALGLSTSNYSYGNTNDGKSKLMNGMTSYNMQLNVSVETQKSAEKAITTINNALNMISEERAKLGAYQNSLEKSVDYLGISYENQVASESRIRDVDMAQEMTKYTRNQILMQSGTAMLAQANSKPQSVLQLLR
jgi:flagellin